jgi:hypothetical protein
MEPGGGDLGNYLEYANTPLQPMAMGKVIPAF